LSILSNDQWLDLLGRAAAGENVPFGGGSLPAMPDPQVQIRTVGQAGAGAMTEAWDFAAQCLERFRTSPRFKEPGKVLLDFGTGWGRIARCFMRDFLAENLIGADVDGDLIAICQQTFPGPRFFHSRPNPPLEMQNETVDFITGYSVFSHLSEAACRAWIAEFARILKPGGVIALTTRGRWFFDYAATRTGTDPYSQALARMFPNFELAKTAYDRGEFVHSNANGVTGGGVLDGSFYGETFIPERFAKEVLGSGPLQMMEFFPDQGHPIMFFQKRLSK
jgi:SAM-dependent methyltransferase